MTLKKTPGSISAARTGPSLIPLKNGGYFALDDPGAISEILNQLSPAVHDEEVARHISQFLRASDAVDGARLESLLPFKRPNFSSDQLGEKHSYFGFKDAHATEEALRFLGPSVVDETLSGYYGHYLA